MNDYEKLKLLHTYIKKCINTTISEKTLRDKLRQCNELYSSCESKLIDNIDDLSDEQLNSLISKLRKYNQEIKGIIKIKLDKLQIKKRVTPKTKFKQCRVAKVISCEMAEENDNRVQPVAIFDIKQASSIIHPYDGSVAGFDTFIDSVKLLQELIQPTHMAMAVKFIKTRLSGKARSGLPDTIVTIDALIDHVRSKCQDTTTPDSIVAQLNTLRQRGPITSFCEEIENLCSKLENVYVSQKVPEDVAKTMTTKAGVNALIKGVTASETKLILKAGNYSSIKDALQKAQECANDVSTSQVFTIKSKQHTGRQDNRSNFRGNGFNRNQHYRNPPRGGFNRFTPRPYPNYYHYSSRGRYQRGGYNNRGRFNDNRPRFDNTNRIYMANVDQLPGPPQSQNRDISNRAPQQQQQNQQQSQRNFLDQC